MVKAGMVSNKPKSKDSAIPNAFPNKEELVNEIEKQHLDEKEERLNLIKANKEAKIGNSFTFEQSFKADVDMKEVDEQEKYGGLTNEELIEAERLIDPESAIQAANISKKSYWNTVKNVVIQSDIVVQVLDARDPEGTRVAEIEEKVKQDGKKIIYLLNKKDLVPDVNVVAWQKWFKAQGMLCIPFKANGILSNKAENSDDDEESKEQKPDDGKDRLMAVLFKYARKFMEKKD